MDLYIADYVYDKGEFRKDRAVLVDKGVIRKIDFPEAFSESREKYNTVKWENRVLLPGTVNVHNHSFQSLLRGIATDRPFLEWRDNALYKYSRAMRREDIYTGALFAFTEMMKRGVTTVCDFFYLHTFGLESDEAVIQAAKDAGIRLVLARTMYDWKGAPEGYVETIDEAVKNTRLLAEKYAADPMVSIVPAPHSLHAATPEMIQAGHRLARELDTFFHIHVAEEPFEVDEVKEMSGGLTTVEFLDKLGVVDDRMVLIHGVWLKDSEIKLLGERGARLAYCPSSNMFLADGITDIPGMVKAGVTVGLGSDGACSNNRISIFEEMRMVSLLQKAKTCDAMCVNYTQAFDMGTVNGAKILGLDAGEIREGLAADFVGIDLTNLSMMPLGSRLEQMLPNIVYSMEPSAVKEVVVNGRPTVKDGELTGISEGKVGSMVRETIEYLEQHI